MIAFFGRFHVLAVHLPIGVIVLAAAIEAAATRERWRDRADGVLGPILGAAFASALLAYLLGTALALEGGRARDLVELHRWLALGTVGASLVACSAWWLHRKRGVTRWVHRGALASLVLVLSGAAHIGGSITHGESYLVELAPGPLGRWLSKAPTSAAAPPPAAPVAEPTLFDGAVLPMLVERCGECHGAAAAKSGLRLDSYDAIVKGGRGGPGIVVGHADASALVVRIEKPLSDDEHMPPEGRPQATADELALLRFWIDRGASRELRLRDVLVPEGARSLVASAAARTVAVAPPPVGSAGPEASASSAPAVSAAPGRSAAPSAGAAPEDDPFAALVAESAAKTTQRPAQSPTSDGSTTASPAIDAPTIDAPTTAPPPTTPAASWEAVAPILASKCGACHGAAKQKAKLRTDSLEALLRGGISGAAVVLGNAKRGTLLERVHLAKDDPMHMPPEEEPQLGAAEVRAIEQWIAAPRSAKTPPALSSAAASVAVAPSASSSAGTAEGAPSAEASAPTAPSAAPSTGPSTVGSSGAEPAALPLVMPGPASEPAQSGGCASCRAAPSDGPRHAELTCAALLVGALQLRRRLRPRHTTPRHRIDG